METTTSNSPEMPSVFIAFIEAKAAHDFHYGNAYNSYPEGSIESSIYQDKLTELANKKGQVQ